MTLLLWVLAPPFVLGACWLLVNGVLYALGWIVAKGINAGPN